MRNDLNESSKKKKKSKKRKKRSRKQKSWYAGGPVHGPDGSLPGAYDGGISGAGGLGESDGIIWHTNTESPAGPSGRAGGVGAGSNTTSMQQQQVYGDPPRRMFTPGETGSPSASFSVTASKIMQSVGYNDRDKEDYEEYMKNPPYKTWKGSAPGHYYESKNPALDMLLEFILESVNEAEMIDEDEEEIEEPDVDEASTTAGVSGYTLPLGASNRKKGQQHPWKSYARAFAGAKAVSRKKK